MAKAKHSDRGDGACATCFEPMPCRISLGSFDSLLDIDERIEREKRRDIEYAERKERQEKMHRLITERLEQIDMSHVHVSEYSRSVTMPMEDLLELLTKIPTTEGEQE